MYETADTISGKTCNARLEASISWVLTRAFGTNIPPGLKEPFYTDKQDRVCLRPVVINGLVSSDIYCRACRHIFRETTMNWKGHMSVMQALSRKGIYVMDPKQSAVTESMLMQNSPFQLDSHLSLIDALMTAYTVETVTVERVVQAVRRFTSFNASSELPYDTEDAILFWLNKVCGIVRNRLSTGGKEDSTSRSRSKSVADSSHIPVMDDLLKDLNDGCCLAPLISFYCPIALRLHDIAMSEGLGIADSMFNIQLVLEFCDNHLPLKTLHLTMNDLFYTSDSIKPHLLAFLAELFFWFEVKKADCVQDVAKMINGGGGVQGTDNGDVSPSKKAHTPTRGTPTVPISTATKKSFHGDSLRNTDSTSTPDLFNNSNQSMPRARQPLLPKRLQEKKNSAHEIYKFNERIRRSRSFTSVHDKELKIADSFQAWGENGEDTATPHGNPRRGHTSPVRAHGRTSQQSSLTNVTNSNLLSNVSIDTEGSLDISTDTSMTISGLEETPRTATGRTNRSRNMVNEGDLDLQSFSSATTSRSGSKDLVSHGDNPGHKNPGGNPGHKTMDSQEPLMPAQVRPSKEKVNNGHSKGFESGESQQLRKSPVSPTKSSKLTTFRDINNPVSIDDESPSDSEYLTPSTENVPFQGFEFPPKASEGEPPLSPSKTKSGLAFFVDTEHSLSTSTPKTGRSTAQSFVINGTEYTAETARAAGIPVVSSNEYRGTSPRRQWDKPGPMFESSLNSSGDGSDQELRKIRADHRDKESPKSPKAAAESFFITANGEMVTRPDSLNIKTTGSSSSVKQHSNTRDTPSPKTSFAEISQRKSSGDISSGLNQSDSDSQSTLSLKEQFEKARQARTGVKKTTFAALPNQTTWQETAQKNNDPSPYDERAPAGIPKEGSAMGSELIDVRMQLEERRRQIENEKRKTEMQWSKQRQKVGKQAFMQVINKNKDDSSSSSIVGKKVIPKTIPENKEISPTTSQRPGTNLQNSRTSPNRTSPSRASPSRNKVSRSQSERIPASQRTSSHNILRNKPLASEAEDRLQEIMQRLETIEMPSSSRKASKESHSASSSTSSMKGLMEQDSLTNVHQTNHARSGGSKPQQQQQSKSSSSATSATNKKPFSREDIQSKIDGVKQRWFSGDERSARSGSTPPRQTQAPSRHGTAGSEMMSHSSEEPLEGGIHQKPPTPASTAMSQSLGEQKEYSSSLDKLNTSLSELQGEIMRLSLQQDQIKCMVKDEKRASPTPGGNVSGEKEVSKSQGDQFYLYPREGNAGEPDVAGGMRTVPTLQQPQQPQPQPAAPPVQPATQPTQPQHSTMPGQMPPGQYPGGYSHYHQPHTYGGPVMAGGYVPPPIQHPSVQGYGQSPHYNPSVQSPQHGYILPPGVPPTSVYPNATTTGHWGGTGPHHQPTGGYHHLAVGVPSPIAGHIPPHTTAYHQQPVNYPQSDQQLGGLAGHHSTMGSTAGLYHDPSRQVPVSTATTPGSHHHTPLSPQQQPVTMPTTTASTGYPPSTGSGSHHSSHHTTPSHSQVQSPVASQRQSPARQSPSYRNSPSPEKTVHSPPNTTVVTAAAAGVITSPVGSVHSNASSGGGNIRSPLGNNSSVVSPIDPAKLFNDEGENGVQDRNQPAEGEPGQEGFFVVFDEGTPVKPKPQLGNRKKDPDSTKAAGRKISPPGPPYPHYPSHEDQLIPAGMAPMPADVGDVRDSEPPRSESPYGAPPEAFVISHDDEEDGGEQSEIVKRKQKFIVMQNKRREEENKKKRKLEEERQKMKEEQRVKEEQADRKKQEEKSRREQIFQDYLKRKEEREIEQELSRVGMAPVQKRNQQKQKTKARTRPKSQPPSSLHEGDKYSASSHSSQEDLARTRGRSPADRARKGLSVHESPKHGPSREMLFSPDHPDSNNLAYGGLTHRRPPTPDKSRLPPGLGDHANNNNTDYSGPKLFKKPSAKSNRQVVNQAVSHCCLAGTVNNDNKNKVLEILNHSEANHFVILFRDHSMQYRGLYTYNPETEEIFKLSGVGPKQVTSKMVEGFYKYNSGAKKFSQVTTTKHMSATIDAITIHTSHWVKKKVDKKPPTGHY